MLANLLDFYMWSGLVCPLLSIQGVSSLVAGFSDHRTLVWRCFLLAICPLFSPISQGFPVILEELLRDCEQRPVNSVTLFLFPLSHDGEGVDGLFSFSPVVFLFLPSFLVFYEEERFKKR